MTVSAPKTASKKTKTSTKAAPSKKAATPAKKAAAPAKKAAPAPAPTPVVENVVQETTPSIESSMTTVLTSFTESIQALTLSLNKLKGDFKVLEKQVIREAKTMDKVNAKRNKNKGSRAPSGFVKPAAISKELAKFLGVEEGSKMARTDVTKMITSYVKEHGLQSSENGRKIVPDAKLKALLNVSDKDEVTYFNLQKYMKHHFVKA
jgi:upstream activation factor subunit UAF30